MKLTNTRYFALVKLAVCHQQLMEALGPVVAKVEAVPACLLRPEGGLELRWENNPKAWEYLLAAGGTVYGDQVQVHLYGSGSLAVATRAARPSLPTGAQAPQLAEETDR